MPQGRPAVRTATAKAKSKEPARCRRYKGNGDKNDVAMVGKYW